MLRTISAEERKPGPPTYGVVSSWAFGADSVERPFHGRIGILKRYHRTVPIGNCDRNPGQKIRGSFQPILPVRFARELDSCKSIRFFDRDPPEDGRGHID